MPSKYADHVPTAQRQVTGLLTPHTDGSEYTSEQWEFIRAMHRYKREYNRPYPDCKDILLVLKALGYRKIMPPAPISEISP